MLQRQMQIVVRAELLLQEFGDLAALACTQAGNGELRHHKLLWLHRISAGADTRGDSPATHHARNATGISPNPPRARQALRSELRTALRASHARGVPASTSRPTKSTSSPTCSGRNPADPPIRVGAHPQVRPVHMPVHPGVADTVEPLVASPCGSRMLLPIHRYRAYNTLHPGAMWTAWSANHVVGTTESASVVANQVRVSDRGAAAANPAARAAPRFSQKRSVRAPAWQSHP